MVCHFFYYFTKGEWLSIITAIATVSGVWYAARQLHHVKKSSYAAGYLQASLYMQEELFREARKAVYKLERVPFEQWNEIEKKSVELVCHRFSTLAELVKFEVITYKMGFVWHPAVSKSWKIVKPLVEERRLKSGFSDLWSNFEWFANLASPKPDIAKSR